MEALMNGAVVSGAAVHWQTKSKFFFVKNRSLVRGAIFALPWDTDIPGVDRTIL